MSERKLLFLMNQEQAREFARLLGAAERGVGAAACRLAVERGEDKAVQEVERLEAGRGPRVLQLAPADTAQVRPCSLAVGVLPPDGPREQLQPSQTAPTNVIAIASHVITPALDEPVPDQVRALVEHGEFPRGTRLPAERDLAQWQPLLDWLA